MSYEDSSREWHPGAFTRRRLMRRAAELSAMATLPAVLAACGDDDDESSGSDSGGSGGSAKPKVEGTITLRDGTTEALGAEAIRRAPPGEH